MRRKNHYVPEVYLKNFADANGKLWAYRLLVEHSNVPEWRSHSSAGIAYHSHLYTRLATGAESPSAGASNRVLTSCPLATSDGTFLALLPMHSVYGTFPNSSANTWFGRPV
jgi:hypothetical protein